MKSVLTVFYKEVLDNLRDRQTVFYALLFGPVLMPLLIAASLVASLSQISVDYHQISTLHVLNAERAPNLVRFLHANNIDTEPAPAEPENALRSGAITLVLEFGENFDESFREGNPAPLTLYVNEADKSSTKLLRKVRSVLEYQARLLSHMRLQVRGLDPELLNTLEIRQVDVSEDGASGQILASLLPFLFIISMVMGGFYLAIDTTAGERDRQSLEPLLSLPINRWQITSGKYLATMLFITVSAILTAISIYLLFRFMPSKTLNSQFHFDGWTISKSLLLMSPLILLITGLLITVSAWTRSTKEAQTYLGLLMVIPMAPFFLLQFTTIRSATFVMLLPMLSQYKLLEKVVKNDTIAIEHIVLSICGTLLGAFLLLKLAFWLYQQDRILR